MMTSHEYAEKLLALAATLKAGPDFSAPSWMRYSSPGTLDYFYDKDDFIEAVKAVGPGKKDWSIDDKIRFLPDALPGVVLSIERDKVCRLVKPAEYECEPLLSESEIPA